MGKRKIVCVQGLGFVGAAMAVAIASAKSSSGEVLYNVIGVDLDSDLGKKRINSINDGVLPFETKDELLKTKLEDCVVEQKNFRATYDDTVYEAADVVIVDVPLDLDFSNPKEKISVNLSPFKSAITTLAKKVKPGTLIIIETTVPPGTCEHVVYPIFEEIFKQRGLPTSEIIIAHSYERVMPGKDYLKSITDFWRVFSGITEKAADMAENFLKTIINTEKYPMKRLEKTVASETAKVLENSYRAMTIAFMEEWGRFSEEIGFDLFDVIDAIRVRPTHSNMRTPGFGVGGYCLTKDPLFSKWAVDNYFNKPELDFSFCRQAVELNQQMPFVTFSQTKKFLGDLRGKNIIVYGVSYRQDVGDTRYSPTQPFVERLQEEGAIVTCVDPLVDTWEELNIQVQSNLDFSRNADLLVFCVPHEEFAKIVFEGKGNNYKVIDANRVLNQEQLAQLKELKIECFSIGRGENI